MNLKCQVNQVNNQSEQASSDSTSPDIKEIINVIPSVIEILNTIEPKMERAKDFVSLLKNIQNGKLVDNIALHLLLDVGQFLRNETVNSIRYSQTTR